MEDKILIKDRYETVEIAEVWRKEVQSVVGKLTTEQLDRYYRARRVFYLLNARTIEFEDTSV